MVKFLSERFVLRSLQCVYGYSRVYLLHMGLLLDLWGWFDDYYPPSCATPPESVKQDIRKLNKFQNNIHTIIKILKFFFYPLWLKKESLTVSNFYDEVTYNFYTVLSVSL